MVRLRNLAIGASASEPLTGHTAVTGVPFEQMADGRLLLASSSTDSRVRLWDPATDVPIGSRTPAP
jgi:hypothetical protein